MCKAGEILMGNTKDVPTDEEIKNAEETSRLYYVACSRALYELNNASMLLEEL
jgi:ATP-dependent exoDNAse (exonuclease V) beta subunit